jgi:uncharacterized protein (TIGR02996 family)
MTPDEAFLQDIIESPDDDSLRLIYADFLDERGDPRGEFIRVQCELARLSAANPRRTELVARERELLEQHEEAVATLLESPHISGLRSLSLHENAIGSTGLAAIAASPLLGHLLAAAAALGRLSMLDLCGNDISNGMKGLLRARSATAFTSEGPTVPPPPTNPSMVVTRAARHGPGRS